jgi:hypothetical protein
VSRRRLPAAAAALAIAAAGGLACGPGDARGEETGLMWWTTGALDKVRPADPPGEPYFSEAGGGHPGRGVELFAARNEFEPFQLVLRAARQPVRGVDVEVTDLVADGGGGRIAGRHAAVYREGFVTVATPSSIEGATGEWPDPLLPRVDGYAGERRDAFPFDLAPARNQPLWIELYVPPGTAAGSYRGEVQVSVGGARRFAVPVVLHAWPFTLPSTSSLPTSFGFAGPTALKQHRGSYTSDDDLYSLTRLYAEAALRHRLSLHGGSMAPPPARYRDGRAELDWSRYDREVGPLLDGTVFGDGDPLPGARLTSIDLTTRPRMAEARRVLYWRAWAGHFRERGWLDRLFVYLWDEPEGERDYRQVRDLGRAARRADPELATLLTEQLVPSLASEIDLWVTLVNCVEPRPGVPADCERTVTTDGYRAARRRGARLWWYQSCASHGCDVVGGPEATGWPSYVVDVPAMANRVMPWLAWAYGIEGELYYNTVEAWAVSPDPWTDVATHGGNGDGTLFYPGTPDRIGGTRHVPVESIRLKLIREGLEDYEYLVLLARAGERRLADDLAAKIVQRTYRWQRRPEALYTVRQTLGRELTRLSPDDGRGDQEGGA